MRVVSTRLSYFLSVIFPTALRAGAIGFLLKSAPPSTIIEGVRLAATGESLIAPSVTKRLVEHYVHQPPKPQGTPPALSALTERELDVHRTICDWTFQRRDRHHAVLVENNFADAVLRPLFLRFAR